ncbi:MAG TPA: nicotinate phosphoribosyltransferase, partial [Erysipelotrichaceae bacterium]|nr:nicotinate phosphoribosyltransferase [Erysipelotrichaceae bacterium]
MKYNVNRARNITLVMDFYELTMSYSYFKKGMKDEIVYFDMFYRKNPDNGGVVITAGLQQLIEAVEDMHFSDGDLDYLRSLHIFDEAFLDYLKNFKFTGDIWAVPEGTPVFPYEPLVT